MQADLSILHLLTEASLLVQLVMLLLLVLSLVSWTMIFKKRGDLAVAVKQANVFEQRFWEDDDLNQLYDKIHKQRFKANGLSGIFEAGFGEFMRLKERGHPPEMIMAGTERAMRVAVSREIDALETHLSFLATVGSTSPYIGLFGTVWGIMNSFRSLAGLQAATLANVAPGIAEALIATAMGLFAAIPAVVAYNRFSNDVERLINRYHTFMEELSTLLQRHASN
ncbi:MAG: protein TolQ [Gammaproteobacteria bacterium]|nr:protein TolQ [Gammaproteobacteria bacterium]